MPPSQPPSSDPLPGLQHFTAADVEVLDKERRHDGYFKVDRYRLRHRKHDGGWSAVMSREIFERGHAAAVLLFDPDLDKLVLIEQFRPGALAAFASPWFDAQSHSPWVLECVAGIIEDGQDPAAVAVRESVEEADCTVLEMVPIAHYLASPGGTSESVFLYCARVDAARAGGVHGLDEEHEDIRVVVIDTATAFAWLDQGRFINAMTLIAMQWFQRHHQSLLTRWGVPD